MTDRSSRLLEHVVVQEPSPSSSPQGPRLNTSVAIEIDNLQYNTKKEAAKAKDRRRLRRRPKPWTLNYAKRAIRKLMRSKEWSIFMIIIIIYVLFVDDIVAMSKSFKGNGLFVGIGASKMVVLGIFIIEFILQVFAMWREYNYKSLFFWLDIIAIGSLIPDILLLAYGSNSTATVSTLAIARAGRAARASGRVARILRVSEFFSCFGFNRKEMEEKERRASDPPVGLQPSRMGIRLINRTTNKVVIIVLVLLFVSSFLQAEIDATPFVRGGLAELEVLHDLGDQYTNAFTTVSQSYISAQKHIIYLQVRGAVLREDRSAMDGIFPDSLLKFKSADAANVERSEVWYDNRDEMAVLGAYSFGLLVLVIVLLTVGNLLIIRDATRMVIAPMERVLAVLKQLSPDRRSSSSKGRNGSSSGGSRREARRSRDATDTSDDLTSSSGMDDDDDEAEVLFGMLNDIDGNLQAAKERAEMEADENQRLRNRIMDLICEKKLVETQITGIKRRARTKDTTTNGGEASGGVVDVVESALNANRSMSRVATAAQKVNFSLAIGGRKFMSFMETDTQDIRFSHPTPNTTPNSTPTSSPSTSPILLHERERSSNELETVPSVTLAGVGPTIPPARLELPQVQVATLDRLIERLTYEEYTDPKFIYVFLLTYRSILSPQDLMERLIVRFCYVTPSVLLPPDASHEVIEEWRKVKQEPVRIGVYNALKLWIGRCFWDFRDEELVSMLREFMNFLLPETNMDRHAINMESLFNKKSEEDRSEIRTPYIPPAPLTPEEIEAISIGESEFSRYEISDLAKQLTLVEHDLFKAVKPFELLNQGWTKKHKERYSPNILRLIDHFNNVSAWIKTQIVKSNKAKDRATAIRKAIALGEELLKLNNFNGAMEVLAALSNASVSRLKKTWALLPASSTESFQELGQLMSSQSSFKLYRERLHTSPPPCVPYIGVYLSDLVFIDEGNPDTVEGPIPSPLINFDKHRQVANVVTEIQKYQQTTYKLDEYDEEGAEDEGGIEPNAEIAAFVVSLRGIDDDTAYKTSLVSEPRARAGSALSGSLSPSPSFLQRLRNSTPNGTL